MRMTYRVFEYPVCHPHTRYRYVILNTVLIVDILASTWILDAHRTTAAAPRASHRRRHADLRLGGVPGQWRNSIDRTVVEVYLSTQDGQGSEGG
jgi:hypothetical protein